MANRFAKRFHAYHDHRIKPHAVLSPHGWIAVSTPEKKTIHRITEKKQLSYRFYSHFHPYVDELSKRLLQGSLDDLQAADTDYVRGQDGRPVELPDGKPMPKLYEEIFSQDAYDPSDMVAAPHPVRDLDFTTRGAYSGYNWELFYHVPMMLGIHLSRNGRYEEAQRWFHFVFDPTDDSQDETPQRFWRVRPFQYTDVQMIDEILRGLSSADEDTERFQELVDSISAWKDKPFRPHAVARFRQSAYMKKAVMAYLDNLIAWGDSLFRQDTRESINEAMQLYVLAANVLGPRPRESPRKGSVRPQTYHNLRKDLDEFNNVLSEIEVDIPFDVGPHPGVSNRDMDGVVALRSVAQTLYFCIPHNRRLLEYWDTVADRLFKIRNSLNLRGIFRQLALFEPPIDPGMLAKAAAAGLDVGAVLAGANQPLPLVRFRFLVQKAFEVCQEVKSLGSQLLSTMEKRDSEALAILRAQHESASLKAGVDIRYSQWQEAVKAREGLEQTLRNGAIRYIHYERLLGRDLDDIEIPELDALDEAGLAQEKLKAEEPRIDTRETTVDIAGGPAGVLINRHEAKELEFLDIAQALTDVASGLDFGGSALNLIPMTEAKGQPLGVGAGVGIGGPNLSGLMRDLASGTRAVASRYQHEASKAAKVGSYKRREQGWSLQSNIAAGEISGTFKQLRAAQIREYAAKREWENQKRQVELAEEIEVFLTDDRKGKKTNVDLYTWMKRELKGIYSQAFQFAFETAKKAERALQHELGDSSVSMLKYGYLGGNEGLVAGERLYLDLKRMEMAYHDLREREYELTEHVSLKEVDPRALIELRRSGSCRVRIPEEFFDLMTPGHFFRRIKSVAISIPCVVGPYTGVHCTLTLSRSTVRTSPLLLDGAYARREADDDRFNDHFGSMQSIVTSSAQSDGGFFEPEPGDERYLPFEGAGAISEWQLRIGSEIPLFDLESISDVIFHLRYTAREGGERLRGAANTHLEERIRVAEASGSIRLLSVRNDFPDAWARFKTAEIGGELDWAPLRIQLGPEAYPWWSRGRIERIHGIEVLARTNQPRIGIAYAADAEEAIDKLEEDTKRKGVAEGRLAQLPEPMGELELYFDTNELDDLWIAVRWGREGQET